MDRLQPRRFAEHLARQFALSFDEDVADLADAGGVERGLIAVERGLQALEAVVHHLLRHRAIHLRRRGAGAGGIFEAETLGIADRVDQAEGIAELLLTLAGEADDEVARQRDVGPRGADAVEDAQI